MAAPFGLVLAATVAGVACSDPSDPPTPAPPVAPPPPPPPPPPPAPAAYRVEYGTFVGGTGEEELREPIILAGGRLLVSARTESSDATTTTGAFQRTFGGTSDTYLAIVSADGSRLEAATYFGGSGFERPSYGSAVTSGGDFVFTSGTGSANLPTSASAYRRTLHPNPSSFADGYVCRIAPDLRTMRWCTYTGGGWPRGGLALDAQDNVLVVGNAEAGSLFVGTAGAAQTQIRGTNDGFVLKLASDGTRALWATLIGGSAAGPSSEVEVVLSVKVLPSGELSISGVSYSTDFPTRPGAPMSQSLGPDDAFIARLNSTCTQLLRSTLFGGSGGDGPGHPQALLSDGSVIIGGNTQSPSLPGAVGTRRGSNDGMVAKLNSAGTAFEFVRIIGGSGDDILLGPQVDAQGRIYIVGWTTSTDIPVTPDALQPNYGGGSHDGVIFILDPDGTPRYVSYLGGSGDEVLRAVAVGPAGEMYLVGSTDSSNFPVTAGAHKTQRGGIDGFVVKMVPR